MSARLVNQLWMIAGLAAVVLLGLLTWSFGVTPQRTDAASLKEQTNAAYDQANILRARIAKLEADKAKLPTLKAQRAARKAALPANSGVPAFLRQLQATGTKVGADISGITVGDPEPVDATPGVWALPIQLTADGTPAQLDGFLKQLQAADQKRAVLIEIANLTSEGSAAGSTSLNLTVKAFVAPPVGTTNITTN
ncbi:MAG TPA: type 4a pilus biogenesis protein PilO [Actinoplanes sp.]|nr:type 4a pilus biogenesis protein PilO [Actinoplanes sp.]